MKFIAPELEVKMFNVNDILTTSGADDGVDTEYDVSAAVDTLEEGNCVGTSADQWLEDCL